MKHSVRISNTLLQMLYMKAGYRFNKPRIQMFTEWSTLFVFRAKIEATRSSDKQLTYHI